MSKRPHLKDLVNEENANKYELAKAITQIKQMWIYLLLDLKSKTNLDETLSKNPVNGSLRLVQEIAKSVTETSSKMREPKTYDEAINDSIYGNR